MIEHYVIEPLSSLWWVGLLSSLAFITRLFRKETIGHFHSLSLDNYLSTLQYKKAYALASSKIEGCNDNNIMWSLKQKVYDSYQNDFCERHITKVNSYLSAKDYQNAISEINAME